MDLNVVDVIENYQWAVGLILGAGVTQLFHWFNNNRQRSRELKIASMQVATLLRNWLSDCSNAVLDHQNWEGNDGQMGKQLSKIPDLNTQQSLDQIGRLNADEAKDVFEWIHKTKDAGRTYAYLLDVDAGEIATDQLENDCGNLFISGLKIYDMLAARVAWKLSPFSEVSIKRMADLADRAR